MVSLIKPDKIPMTHKLSYLILLVPTVISLCIIVLQYNKLIELESIIKDRLTVIETIRMSNNTEVNENTSNTNEIEENSNKKDTSVPHTDTEQDIPIQEPIIKHISTPSSEEIVNNPLCNNIVIETPDHTTSLPPPPPPMPMGGILPSKLSTNLSDNTSKSSNTEDTSKTSTVKSDLMGELEGRLVGVRHKIDKALS
ncbi:hypothetical protein NEPAR06_0103 [Nematocida parisii]|uniref:Uncharacterized protein n=1 Tax=Nematocida parisii (strain ERTm3) TaxID=935791 RepID=I3EE81_NEMP3|nr:uncharacterized protein NEPG_00132 [Nematocida parisii ERTm1]EIJ87528.1 hypothetical protein NEQG_02409 [Nematocida parisii ERTm3]KAI5142793.1 hypothetical protein NEPAR07_0319 [Nematocida parisii]EIJ94610.1 hypothetical protein NEPG_00132 [Nematocida parisii ERTm1]KAI5152982.1 hypothetical protein NEPAR06_0103 [Nematocida parisii]KAI5157328.1 hypothetical protein NEPAR05_1193 [Nematocida parisii]|eukprot:XP_013057966.1 hypothetical protein NEPG_00132 [Nematocida parisii ERTm1]